MLERENTPHRSAISQMGTFNMFQRGLKCKPHDGYQIAASLERQMRNHKNYDLATAALQQVRK